MSVKSGLFEGFAAQQRFMRCASAGWQLAGKGGRSFCKIRKNIIRQMKEHVSEPGPSTFGLLVYAPVGRRRGGSVRLGVRVAHLVGE